MTHREQDILQAAERACIRFRVVNGRTRVQRQAMNMRLFFVDHG